MLISNSYYKGFLDGSIYTGSGKEVCLPGLNCYSCPGALGACPIGAMQAVVSSRSFQLSYYITGYLTMLGAGLGRFVCGWLCPFGFAQDLLFRVPVIKRYVPSRPDKFLRVIKYGILIVFVLLLPMFVLDFVGQGQPWFCKWICPSGTLMAGWPLSILNDGIRETIGFLFFWKTAILIGLLILSMFVYRPFCKYLCPLGAIYGMFNPISFYRFRLNESLCTNCNACLQVCKMNVNVKKHPNSPECIRCGDCLNVCKTKALEKVRYEFWPQDGILKVKSKKTVKCLGHQSEVE